MSTRAAGCSLAAVVDGPRRINYTELASRSHRLAHALRRGLGCRLGDRVAYLCGNTLELLEAYYGVVLAGCILTPLNIRLAPAELQHLPVYLEVPGTEKKGPDADQIRKLRELHARWT